MKDKYFAIIVAAWGVLALLTDYYWFRGPYEFLMRQLCFVLLLIIACLLTRSMKYTHIILTGMTTMAITGFIKEIRFNNHYLDINQVVITLVVIIGICIGIVSHNADAMKRDKFK